jgi:hypothetical protein
MVPHHPHHPPPTARGVSTDSQPDAPRTAGRGTGPKSVLHLISVRIRHRTVDSGAESGAACQAAGSRGGGPCPGVALEDSLHPRLLTIQAFGLKNLKTLTRRLVGGTGHGNPALDPKIPASTRCSSVQLCGENPLQVRIVAGLHTSGGAFSDREPRFQPLRAVSRNICRLKNHLRASLNQFASPENGF